MSVEIPAGSRVGKPAGAGPEHVFPKASGSGTDQVKPGPFSDITLCGVFWRRGWVDRILEGLELGEVGVRGRFCQNCLRAKAAGR